jgi:hypothetical protein
MKKLLTATTFLTLTLLARSQAYVTFGTKTSIKPVYASAGVGGIFNNGLVIEAEAKVPISSKVAYAVYLSPSMGYQLMVREYPEIAITPLISYSYHYRSNDKAALNYWSASASVRVNYNHYYIQPAYLDKRLYIGIGIIGKFNGY